MTFDVLHSHSYLNVWLFLEKRNNFWPCSVFVSLFLLVSTSAINCLSGRLVSEMTYYVSSATLNHTHSLTRIMKQGTHRHQTPPRSRNAARCNKLRDTKFVHAHTAHYGNVTSSIKSEVHNVAQCSRKRTEPRPQEISIQNFVPIGPAVPEICSRRRQTQTDGLITIHRTPNGAK